MKTLKYYFPVIALFLFVSVSFFSFIALVANEENKKTPIRYSSENIELYNSTFNN